MASRRNAWSRDHEDDDDDFDRDDFDAEDSSDDLDADDESTIACPYCRRQIHEESERCPYCEQYISAEDRVENPRPWWIVLGAVLALFGAIGWFIF